MSNGSCSNWSHRNRIVATFSCMHANAKHIIKSSEDTRHCEIISRAISNWSLVQKCSNSDNNSVVSKLFLSKSTHAERKVCTLPKRHAETIRCIVRFFFDLPTWNRHKPAFHYCPLFFIIFFFRRSETQVIWTRLSPSHKKKTPFFRKVWVCAQHRATVHRHRTSWTSCEMHIRLRAPRK